MIMKQMMKKTKRGNNITLHSVTLSSREVELTDRSELSTTDCWRSGLTVGSENTELHD